MADNSKNSETPPTSVTPWWISEYEVVTAKDIKKRNTRTVSFGIAISMALIAGVVGSLLYAVKIGTRGFPPCIVPHA